MGDTLNEIEARGESIKATLDLGLMAWRTTTSRDRFIKAANDVDALVGRMRELERDVEAIVLQRDERHDCLNRIRAAAEADADLAGLPALRSFLLRETEVASLPGGIFGLIPEAASGEELNG